MNSLALIDENCRRRIISTAALLSSPQDGERLAASHGLDRLLNPHGVGVADVFRAALDPVHIKAFAAGGPSGGQADCSAFRRARPSTQHQRMARMCLCQASYINDWEQRFLIDILAQGTLSTRQHEKLEAIAAKIDRLREANND